MTLIFKCQNINFIRRWYCCISSPSAEDVVAVLQPLNSVTSECLLSMGNNFLLFSVRRCVNPPHMGIFHSWSEVIDWLRSWINFAPYWQIWNMPTSLNFIIHNPALKYKNQYCFILNSGKSVLFYILYLCFYYLYICQLYSWVPHNHSL